MAEEVAGIPTGSGDVSQDDKLWALLSYIFTPLVGIVMLLIEDKKSRPFIKYNAVVSIVIGVLTWVLSWACIGFLIWIYGIYLGIKSYQGEMVEVPFVSDFVRKQGWV